MAHPKILVSGATGKIGGGVARELLAHSFPVRAIVRREDERSARLRTFGVNVVVGDLGDAEPYVSLCGGHRARSFCLSSPALSTDGHAR